MNITQADVDRLERYAELLQEVVDLSSDLPTQEQLNALPKHLANLKAINALEAPTEGDMDSLTDYLSDLKSLSTMQIPTPEQMQATREHLERLERIEELTEA